MLALTVALLDWLLSLGFLAWWRRGGLGGDYWRVMSAFVPTWRSFGD